MGGILVLVLSLSMAATQDRPVALAEQYRALLKEFGGDNAKMELFAIRHLVVGKEAADSEGPDQNGVRFKLSDYRGKVVLLYFWQHV